MISKKVLVALVFMFLGAVTSQINAQNDAPRIVGGDKDEHGCIPSAGYTWSTLRKSCIRTFEVGVRLNPKAEKLDKTLSSFLVFKEGKDQSQVEVFMAHEAKSITLNKVKGKKGIWKNAKYYVVLAKDVYTLKDVKGAVLYDNAN